MSGCVRCGAKIGFLGGYITSKGRICERCKEIETLADRLAPLFKKELPLAMSEMLAADKGVLDTARKLLSLDRDRPVLRVALCCFELRGNLPLAETDTSLIEKALYELFTVDASPAHVERILNVESGALAVQFIEAKGMDATEPWLELLRKIAAAGHGTRAVAIAMKAKGIKTPSLCGFIAASFDASQASQLAKWLEQSPFPSVEVVEDFLRIVRKRDENLYAPLLAAAERKYSGGADRLDLLSGLGEDVRLAKTVESLRELTPEIVSALERLARDGKLRSVQSSLTALATPGPYADQICALARSLDSTDDLRNARAVMMKVERWAAARDVLAEKGLLTPERQQVIRAACRDTMARNDEEGLERIGKSVIAFLGDDPKQAHIILTSVISASTARAPLALLSAFALDALVASAELDAALQLVKPLGLVATRRKIRKPLKDEGAVARSIGLLRQAFIDRCRKFVDADGSPAFAILFPPSLDAEHVKAARIADEKRDKLIEDASTVIEAGSMSERAILHAARSRIFCDAVESATEGAPSPRGFRAMERSMIYGLLTRRLTTPLDAEAETPDRTGPRDLCVECAARALAYRPDVPVTSGNKWGDFVFQLSGTLRTLGYESTGVPKMEEFWPSWRNTEDKAEPPNKVLAVKEHFPPLDGMTPVRFEEYYLSPDRNMYPERDKKSWDGSLK
ncbi:MAG: hypothetical protein AAB229_09895 [Candidatus Hydrogenedentota bacterium]